MSLIPSNLLNSLGAFYPRRVSLQQSVAGVYQNVTTLERLAAQITPNTGAQTYPAVTHIIRLHGFFGPRDDGAEIIRNMRVKDLATGTIYKVEDVEHDSQNIGTKLLVSTTGKGG